MGAFLDWNSLFFSTHSSLQVGASVTKVQGAVGRERLPPIAGGGGTQLAAARALAPLVQGRSLYCVRPLRPSLQDSSGQDLVGCPRRCLRRQTLPPGRTRHLLSHAHQ